MTERVSPINVVHLNIKFAFSISIIKVLYYRLVKCVNLLSATEHEELSRMHSQLVAKIRICRMKKKEEGSHQ
jgi:hypothetical protein